MFIYYLQFYNLSFCFVFKVEMLVWARIFDIWSLKKEGWRILIFSVIVILFIINLFNWYFYRFLNFTLDQKEKEI